ncbi:MAG: acyl-CoA thioesterase [Leptospiraceae bacterium]|nr:acyl-CoA thioesterase [Leptospiraceae bacterium]MDW7976604.1 thioesterase family protein [Leptospiraceae bacterium]
MKAVIEYRVPYGDTDKMGIVYYAHYFRYFEMLRNELIRNSGRSYKEIEEKDGLMFPVLEAFCEYLYPAKYDDIIQIFGELVSIEANRFKIAYTIYEKESQRILVKGHTIHICISLEGKPRRLPDYLKSLLSSTKEGFSH